MTNFEAKIKALYPIWGNDTSSYQGRIVSDQFMQVQKPKFLIARMTCGTYFDSQCLATLKNFYGKCDLHVYSAFLPGVNALDQIGAVIDGWNKVKYYVNGRLWLDLEKDGLQTVMGAALGGTAEYGKLDSRVQHKVGIYTNPNYYNIYRMAIDTRLNWRLFWIANYTESRGQTYPNLPAGLTAHLWQYASTLRGYEAGCASASLDGDVFLLNTNRYAETLISDTPIPDPEPELPKEVKTLYSRVNLRTDPTIAPSTDVATTDRYGVELPVIDKTQDENWYRVGLYIHQSCVEEVD